MTEDADPEKTVVGSGKRPAETTARRLHMGSLVPIHLTLFLAAIILAAVAGFVGSAIARRRKRRARRYFLLGFSIGFIAGLILQRRRRVLNDLGAVAGQVPRCMLSLAESAGRLASWPMSSRAALIAGRWRKTR
jgi:hypothetical protein